MSDISRLYHVCISRCNFNHNQTWNLQFKLKPSLSKIKSISYDMYTSDIEKQIIDRAWDSAFTQTNSCRRTSANFKRTQITNLERLYVPCMKKGIIFSYRKGKKISTGMLISFTTICAHTSSLKINVHIHSDHTQGIFLIERIDRHQINFLAGVCCLFLGTWSREKMPSS